MSFSHLKLAVNPIALRIHRVLAVLSAIVVSWIRFLGLFWKRRPCFIAEICMTGLHTWSLLRVGKPPTYSQINTVNSVSSLQKFTTVNDVPVKSHLLYVC